MKSKLAIFVAFFGWLIFIAYLFYDYQAHGGKIFDHLFTHQPLELVFHLFIITAPVGSTITAYLINERKNFLTKTQLSETKFRRLSDASLEGIAITEKGKFLDVNNTFAKMFGYMPSEMVGMDVLKVVAPDFHVDVKQKILSGYEKPYEATCLKRDGKQFPVEVCGKTILHKEGPARVTAIRDITERKIIEEKLVRANSEWKQTFNTVPDFITVIDNQYRIIKANRAVCEKFGLKEQEIVGKLCHKVIHGTDEPPVYCPHREAISDGRQHIAEIYIDNLQGHYLVSSSPILDEEGQFQGVVEVAHEITEQKKLEEELRKSSITDELTGLLNRRGFFTIAQKQCEIAGRNNLNLSFLFLDLDGMKTINDEHGHKVGDQALVETADILRNSFRSSDIIARIGGDEFVVMVTETPETSIDKLTTRLRRNLTDNNNRESKSYSISLSQGLTRYSPEKPCSIDELISQADKLMYEQKRKKKS